MLDALQSNRAYLLEKVFLCCCLLVLAPMSGIAQTPEGVVPITSEPDHKIRFDNGKVRMYEVVLPRGRQPCGMNIARTALRFSFAPPT